jgi:hypothetical protein
MIIFMPDYLTKRHEEMAARMRQLAALEPDASRKEQLLELATQYEKLAARAEDRGEGTYEKVSG